MGADRRRARRGLARARRRRTTRARRHVRLVAPAQALGSGGRVRARRRRDRHDRRAGRAARARAERRRVPGGQRDRRVPRRDAIARRLRRPSTRHVHRRRHPGARRSARRAWSRAPRVGPGPGVGSAPRAVGTTSCSTSSRTRSTCSTTSPTAHHLLRAAKISPAGSKCVPRHSKRYATAPNARRSNRTARPTPRNSSRSRPRRSSTCRSRSNTTNRTSTRFLRGFYRQDPAARCPALSARVSSLRPGSGRHPSKRLAGRIARYASTIGASSVGVAPCMITPSTPEIELAEHPRRAVRRVAGRRRLEPLVGQQRGDVLEHVGVGLRVERARKRRHDLVGAEARQHLRIPAVGLDEQVAVALEIGGEPPDRLLQPQRVRTGDRRSSRSTTRCEPMPDPGPPPPRPGGPSRRSARPSRR